MSNRVDVYSRPAGAYSAIGTGAPTGLASGVPPGAVNIGPSHQLPSLFGAPPTPRTSVPISLVPIQHQNPNQHNKGGALNQQQTLQQQQQQQGLISPTNSIPASDNDEKRPLLNNASTPIMVLSNTASAAAAAAAAAENTSNNNSSNNWKNYYYGPPSGSYANDDVNNGFHQGNPSTYCSPPSSRRPSGDHTVQMQPQMTSQVRVQPQFRLTGQPSVKPHESPMSFHAVNVNPANGYQPGRNQGSNQGHNQMQHQHTQQQQQQPMPHGLPLGAPANAHVNVNVTGTVPPGAPSMVPVYPMMHEEEVYLRLQEAQETASYLYYFSNSALKPHEVPNLESVHSLVTRLRVTEQFLEAWYYQLYHQEANKRNMAYYSVQVRPEDQTQQVQSQSQSQMAGQQQQAPQQAQPQQHQPQAQGQVQTLDSPSHKHSRITRSASDPENSMSNGLSGLNGSPTTTKSNNNGTPTDLVSYPPATSTFPANPDKKVYSKKRPRPNDTTKCHQCGASETPEWRRGPDGARTLCNACGLYHAKLVKKRGEAVAAEIFRERHEAKANGSDVNNHASSADKDSMSPLATPAEVIVPFSSVMSSPSDSIKPTSLKYHKLRKTLGEGADEDMPTKEDIKEPVKAVEVQTAIGTATEDHEAGNDSTISMKTSEIMHSQADVVSNTESSFVNTNNSKDWTKGVTENATETTLVKNVKDRLQVDTSHEAAGRVNNDTAARTSQSQSPGSGPVATETTEPDTRTGDSKIITSPERS